MTDSLVCPIVDFGRSDNLFYFSPIGFAEDATQALSRLQRLTPDQEVVIPAHFLLSPQKDFFIGELNALPCRKRLLIGLSGEEREQVVEVRRLQTSGWGLDLIVEKAVDGEDMRRLALYRDQDVRLVYLVNRRHHQLSGLKSIPDEWRGKSFVLFVPSGERDDLFLTADEVFLFQDDLQKSQPDLELPLMVYRPLMTTVAWNAGAEFFAAPEIENYGAHFLRQKNWPHLRRWMIVANGEKSSWRTGKTKFLRHSFMRFLVPVIFRSVELLRSLRLLIMWPLQKTYWALAFQVRKRLTPRLPSE